jgi:hypothetical protein
MKTNYFQMLNMLFFALFLAPFMLLVVMSVITQDPAEPSLRGTIDVIFGGLNIGLLVLSQLVYGMFIQKARQTPSVKDKMQQFLTANLVRVAMIEAGVMTAAIGYFMTRMAWLLPIGAGMLVWMLLQRPTRNKVLTELDLTPDEILEMDNLAQTWEMKRRY